MRGTRWRDPLARVLGDTTPPFLPHPQSQLLLLTKGYHRNLITLTNCTGMERALTSQDPNLTSPYLVEARLKEATCSRHHPPDPRPTRS